MAWLRIPLSRARQLRSSRFHRSILVRLKHWSRK